MELKPKKDISNTIFTLYQKGLQAFKLNNLDYAIELMKLAVVKEPGFIEARKELRKFELAKTKPGLLSKTLKVIKVNKFLKVAQVKMAMKKYAEAYVSVEDALAINIHNLSALKLLAEIGEITASSFIIVEAYDLAITLFSSNVDLLKLAATAYRKYNLGKKEVDVRKKIVTLEPDNLKARMELREASALATMEKSDWENKEKSYRDKLKSEVESATLEAEEKIIRVEDDVAALINQHKAILDENPDSVKALRELGDIFLNVERYDEAIEMYQKLMTVHDVFDLSIDQKIEKSKIEKLKKLVAQLDKEKLPSSENSEEIESKVNRVNCKISIIKKEYAVERIKKLPNSMPLRFELAKVYWDEGDFDAAIEQFQHSQANLNRRIPSLIFLGRCFMEKNQFDIAIDQFLKVLDEKIVSGEQEFEALYYLGLSYERLDRKEDAAVCFKKIYSVKATYKDIAEIIKRYYKN
jgi:tetratricopeptide (TPR) repeat protein